MIHDASESIKTYMALANLLMAILVRSKSIHRIVNMNRLQSVQPDNSIELLNHTIQISDNVIAAIPNMTGVKTNP